MTLTKEEASVLNVWKMILKKQGLKMDKLMLQRMLVLGKNNGVPASTETAFSIKVWEKTGEKLIDCAMRGDKEALGLLTMW